MNSPKVPAMAIIVQNTGDRANGITADITAHLAEASKLLRSIV
jgi:hypothetical protein